VRIAVVIPAWNEEDRIAAAVACARGTEPASDEVIVVDGGSKDSTCERAREAGARVVSADLGRACQLQAGADATDADAILFVHADTRLPEGHADSIRQALRDPDVVGGAFGFRFEESGFGLRVVEWGVRMRLRFARLPYGDQGLFVRRSALAAAGGIPQVAIMEDLDLVRALQRVGTLALLPEEATTSARRYLADGIVWSVLRNTLALAARSLGVDRERIARWYRS
jgi:rSAM/selenodomain-associated transferase 2